MSLSPDFAPASARSESEAAWQTTKRVAPFIWPAGNFDLRARVVLALLALVATKFVAILSPILQAWAVDDLAGSGVPACCVDLEVEHPHLRPGLDPTVR